MPDKEDEWETTTTIEPLGEVRVRAYIERHSGSRDEVVVHTYTGDKATAEDASPFDREHDLYRFYVIDENDHTCKYHTTRNEPEPSDIALWGLEEYGWTCTNFDQTTNEEATKSIAETYRGMANELLRASGDMNEPTRELLFETWVRLTLAAAINVPEDQDTDAISTLLDTSLDEDDESPELSASLEVPGFIGVENQRKLSNMTMGRLEELISDHMDIENVAIADNRNLK